MANRRISEVECHREKNPRGKEKEKERTCLTNGNILVIQVGIELNYLNVHKSATRKTLLSVKTRLAD